MPTSRVRPVVAAIMAAVAIVALGGCSSDAADDQPDAAPGTAGAVAGGPGEALAAPSTAGTTAPVPGVTVEGSGRISGQPDTLTATVGVEVERPTVQAALDAANAGIQDVTDAVTDAGVAAEDVQTAQFQVHPRYDQEPGESRPTIRGYLVSNLLEVKIRDVDAAGDVLGAATEAAGEDTRVQGIRSSLEDNEALVAQARERAFADARARAEHYAELAGRSLDQLVSVGETFQPPVPVEEFAGEATADAARGSVPIQPGQQEVAVRVTTVWSLE